MNILFILSELIFLLFIFPIVCLFPCRWWKKTVFAFLIETINYSSISECEMLFIPLQDIELETEKALAALNFLSTSSILLFYFSISRLHCLYNSELILPFYLLAKFLQLNLWLRMDYHVDCAPHTQTFNYWSWRRNFIIINIYVGRGESKLQQA